jgi:hypothetical protein
MDAYTYFAIVDQAATRDNPAGIVRRHEFDGGGFVDEGLHRSLTWHRTPAIIEWESGDFPDELIEVTAQEAERIIAGFRERWGTPG